MNKRNQTTPTNWDESILLHFIKGDLTASERQSIDNEMASNEFLKDAVEGLKLLKDDQEIKDSVLLLQKKLKEQTQTRRQRRHPALKPKLWLWVATLTLLILLFVAWLLTTIYIH